MLLKSIEWLFERLVGRIPEPKKKELRMQFKLLLIEVTKAAAEGAVKGAKS